MQEKYAVLFLAILCFLFVAVSVVGLILLIDVIIKLGTVEPGGINLIDRLFFDGEYLEELIARDAISYVEWRAFWRDKLEMFMCYMIVFAIIWAVCILPAVVLDKTLIFKNGKAFLKVPFGKKELKHEDIISVNQIFKSSLSIQTKQKTVKLLCIKNCNEICVALDEIIKEGKTQ